MLPKSANVVVIGGGVLGTSAAFHLAEAGQSEILLIDRGPIASATTPQAAGQTGYLNVDSFALKFGIYCIEFFENFKQRTGHAVDFRQCGSLRVALTEPFQKDLAEHAAALNSAMKSSFSRRPRPVRSCDLDPPGDCSILLTRATDTLSRSPWLLPMRRRQKTAAWLSKHGSRQPVCGSTMAASRAFKPVRNHRAQRLSCRERAELRPPGQPNRGGAGASSAFVTALLPGVRPIQLFSHHRAASLFGEAGVYRRRLVSSEFLTSLSSPGFEGLTRGGPGVLSAARAATSSFRLADAVAVQERRGLPTISPDGRLIVSS
jgi:hypothetical protein